MSSVVKAVTGVEHYDELIISLSSAAWEITGKCCRERFVESKLISYVKLNHSFLAVQGCVFFFSKKHSCYI